MSYTALPMGPMPEFCSECGLRMRERVVAMLPYDPLTGKPRRTHVVECPSHEGSHWGTKHHYDFRREWYHDAFEIADVPEDFKIEKPPKPPMGKWELRAIGFVIGAFAVAGCVNFMSW